MTTAPVLLTDEIVDRTPNHMILWLDKHIGNIENCQLLKRSFITAMHPASGLFERNVDRSDIDRSIQADTSILVQMGEVEFMFQPFVDLEKCFLTIEQNRHKRIFLITSGSKGRILIPGLLAHFYETFIPGYSIYVFCGKMNMIPTEFQGDPTNDWAMNYDDNLLMYNHEIHLLNRMVLDIAMYFGEKGEALEASNQLENARQYYGWSKKMWERYATLVQRNPMRPKIDEMTQRINQVDQKINSRMEEGDDDRIGVPTD